MEIKIPKFERKEVEVRETFIDENGKSQERIRMISVPTGRVLDGSDTVEAENLNTRENSKDS